MGTIPSRYIVDIVNDNGSLSLRFVRSAHEPGGCGVVVDVFTASTRYWLAR